MGGERALFFHSFAASCCLMQLTCYVLAPLTPYIDFVIFAGWLADLVFVRRRGLPARCSQDLVLGIFILFFFFFI